MKSNEYILLLIIIGVMFILGSILFEWQLMAVFALASFLGAGAVYVVREIKENNHQINHK